MGELDFVGDEFSMVGGDDLALVGEDEADDEIDALLGDDDDDGDEGDMVGAIVRRAAGGRLSVNAARKLIQKDKARAIRKVAAQKFAKRGVIVRERPYTSSRILHAGFRALAVAAGATTTVSIEAPVPIQPRRLLISEVFGVNFVLTALSVGLNNHLLTPDGIHCSIFSPEVTGLDENGTGFWKIPPLPTGTNLNMTFENISGQEADLRGSWLCLALT